MAFDLATFKSESFQRKLSILLTPSGNTLKKKEKCDPHIQGQWIGVEKDYSVIEL